MGLVLLSFFVIVLAAFANPPAFVDGATSADKTVIANLMQMTEEIGVRMAPLLTNERLSDVLSLLSNTNENLTLFMPIKEILDTVQMDPSKETEIVAAEKMIRLHIARERVDYADVTRVFPDVKVLTTMMPSVPNVDNAFSRILVGRSSAQAAPESKTERLSSGVNLLVSSVSAHSAVSKIQVLQYIPCKNGVIYLINGVMSTPLPASETMTSLGYGAGTIPVVRDYADSMPVSTVLAPPNSCLDQLLDQPEYDFNDVLAQVSILLGYRGTKVVTLCCRACSFRLPQNCLVRV